MNTYLPPPIAGGQKTAGPRLPARMKVRPLSLTRVIGLRGLAFNASLTDEHGALRLAYRSGWRRASVRICTLTDKDFRPRDDHQLIAPVAEDPRLFHHAGELFVSYASARWSGRKIRRVIMRVARVENGAITTPTFVRLQPKEKNWGFFEYEEQLYAVYAVEPHTVLRFADGLRGEPLEQTPWTRLKSDTLRGGHRRFATGQSTTVSFTPSTSDLAAADDKLIAWDYIPFKPSHLSAPRVTCRTPY